MKSAVGLSVTFCLLIASMATAGERRLHGLVLTVDDSKHPSHVRENIEVVIEEIGSSHFTDVNGSFDYFLRDRDRSNKEITFNIVGMPEYIVQDPVDGHTRIPKDSKLDEPIRLLLVRKGSVDLLTDERYRKSIEDENSKARDQVKFGKSEQRVPVRLTFEEKAARWGVTPEQLMDWIMKTAAEHEKSQDPNIRARSAAANGDFQKAGDLELQAMEQLSQNYARKRQKKQQGPQRLSDRGVMKLVNNVIPAPEEDVEELGFELIKGFRFAGDAYYNAYAFDKALSAYKRALEYVSKEESPELWAAIHVDIGRAHLGVMVQVEGAAIRESLKQAFAAFDNASLVFTKDSFPQQWAMTKIYLSNALLVQSTVTSGESTAQFLAQAVAACEAALTVFTKEAFPQQWAMTQTSLGTVQWFQGNTSQALESFKGVETVYTKDAWPQEWAITQMNLGSVLKAQGIITGAEERRLLFTQALEAYQAALTVYTKDALPQQWAMTQVNLGNLLMAQIENTYPKESLRLLAQAVCRYKAALTVFTREAFPFYWALTQLNLGSVRNVQGLFTSGEDRNHVFTQAIGAYKAALTVYTKDALPQYWAMTQLKLGSLLVAQGATTTGVLQSWLQSFIKWLDLEERTFISEEGRQLHGQGIDAFEATLMVYTKDALPQEWARTQVIIGKSLEFQAEHSGREEGRGLIQQAIMRFQLALQIWTREAHPVEWERTTANLNKTMKALENMK